MTAVVQQQQQLVVVEVRGGLEQTHLAQQPVMVDLVCQVQLLERLSEELEEAVEVC
jgi:hypothetical protein